MIFLGTDSVEWVKLFYFTAIWLQPLFWMGVYDRNYSSSRRMTWRPLLVGALSTALGVIIFNGVLSGIYDFVVLALFYASIGLFLGFLLSFKYHWSFFSALSGGAIVTLSGSVYWEIPYIIRNAFITGPERDWFWHIVGFLYLYMGIRRIRLHAGYWSFVALFLGLAISCAYIVFNPIPPGVGGGETWNTWYYLSNRMICTLILFWCLEKKQRNL